MAERRGMDRELDGQPTLRVDSQEQVGTAGLALRETAPSQSATTGASVVAKPGSGDCVLSAEERARLTRDLSLSRRQSDVVEQLLMGCSDKQIADNLQISVSSVRAHLSKIFLRLGVSDRCQLLVYLLTHARRWHT
jgi:DNA-binding NarL/FixJ family response regulator